LELTNFNQFVDPRSTNMDLIGVAVVQCALISATSRNNSSSHPKKLPEPCNCWNEGLCMLESAQYHCLHVCNKCLLSRHNKTTVHPCSNFFLNTAQPYSTPSMDTVCKQEKYCPYFRRQTYLSFLCLSHNVLHPFKPELSL
jgi:hypothetical protein